MTPESLRVKLWREANRERYNENQRVLMKARREREKNRQTPTPPQANPAPETAQQT